MEADLFIKMYEFYLILFGGYVILLIGTIVYMFEMYRLFKRQEAANKKIQREIVDKIDI